MKYADIIVNISHGNLDKTYEYIIPSHLENEVVIGSQVWIPFGMGNRTIKGFVVDISEHAKFDSEKLKSIQTIVKNSVVLESHFIQLAYWMKENYGGTMNDALKTVLPIKKVVKKQEKKRIRLAVTKEQAEEYLTEFKRKNNKARVRLLEEVIKRDILEYDMVIHQLKIGTYVLKALEEKGIIVIETKGINRNPIVEKKKDEYKIILNPYQKEIVDTITTEYREGIRKSYLVHGITGSGKTEVYMEIIEKVISEGKQVIMLIPEIALSYQTVTRFYRKFGDRISILHSRLSAGERYDQYLRAQNGEIDIMIGPRSAIFTPFQNLGLIIIDEEHESSYKSEKTPKYHARETAIARADMTKASVVLGSATPSLESFYRAVIGEIQLLTLNKRAGNGQLPKVEIVDLREELKTKNRSIFSRKLKELINDRLQKKQQIMLFINRRGYAGFVSCRSCGTVMQCPHCDVSLTAHTDDTLRCHYCGYKIKKPVKCPKCESKYIAAFGTGTQKIEEYVKKEFPYARTLRMDADTTKGKQGHEKIVSSFYNQEADILIGTQMIVKGHDFSKVTLVGIIAADLSLYTSDFRAAEKTFQLLCQASGRAGRGELEGEVVIQTYNPEHYSIIAAAQNDYYKFYQKEMEFRKLLEYPPSGHMAAILLLSKKEEDAKVAADLLSGIIEIYTKDNHIKLLKKDDSNKSMSIKGGAAKFYFGEEHKNSINLIGPAKASVGKINNHYRYILYLKSRQYGILTKCKSMIESYIDYSDYFRNVNVQFDFDPINGY